MMEISNNSRASRLLIVSALLAGLWVFGGIVFLWGGGLDSLSFTDKGHAVTIWLMVAFAFLAGVYLAFAWMSKVHLALRIIVVLLVVLEVFLGISYFNW
jgi:hypothetical protein